MAIGARARVHTIRRTITVLSITFRGRQQRCPRTLIVIRSTQPAFWPFALSRFVVQYGAWDIAHTGYRIHVFSRGKNGKNVTCTSRFRRQSSALRGARRGDRGTGVCMSHIPNFRLPASTRYESM